MASNRGINPGAAITVASFARPIVGPYQSPMRKIGSTTPSYLTLCLLFQPLYIASCPTIGLRMSNIVPSINPKQCDNGHPHACGAFANEGSSSSHNSSRIATLACWYTWCSTTLYISEMAGGDRLNTTAWCTPFSRPASLRNKRTKASSPRNCRVPPRAHKNAGISKSPMSSRSSSPPSRQHPCKSSSLKPSIHRASFATTTRIFHYSSSFLASLLHASNASSPKPTIPASNSGISSNSSMTNA
eukprot:scaffold1313_cov349-Pavlova_lutheri.AAC.4